VRDVPVVEEAVVTEICLSGAVRFKAVATAAVIFLSSADGAKQQDAEEC
jgi:hypothetical protein